MARFDGRIALVTGAASGIGAATAGRLAREGARVLVVDIDGSGAERVAAGCGGVACRADVTDPDDVARMVREAAALGGLDVLVNNATSGTLGRIADTPPAEWQRVVAVNLTAPFLATREALPLMLARGGGAIVNVSSAAALQAEDGLAAYAAAKSGVLALTRNTAAEYGRRGVRANAVVPGAVDTPPTRAFLDAVPAMRGRMEDANVLGRIARPEEVAAVIAFLASDEASFVSGATYLVDGGATAAKPVGLIRLLDG